MWLPPIGRVSVFAELSYKPTPRRLAHGRRGLAILVSAMGETPSNRTAMARYSPLCPAKPKEHRYQCSGPALAKLGLPHWPMPSEDSVRTCTGSGRLAEEPFGEEADDASHFAPRVADRLEQDRQANEGDGEDTQEDPSLGPIDMLAHQPLPQNRFAHSWITSSR